MTPATTRHALVLALMVMLWVTVSAQNEAYRAELEEWRLDHEATLTADEGWLTVAGLYFLKPGPNRVGSDPSSDMVLPSPAPPTVGVFEFAAGRTTFRTAEGVRVMLNGQPVTSGELQLASQDRPADIVSFGEQSLFIHRSGSRYALRLRDRNSALRRNFKGLRWFPINEAFRVTGRFVPYATPKDRQVPNILGDLQPFQSPGVVEFSLLGVSCALEPYLSSGPAGDELFFVFGDLTNNNDTYGGGRFLYTPMPASGTVVLDFNKAQNPPCAFNKYTTCPLPSPQNRLSLRIEAGEKDYGYGK